MNISFPAALFITFLVLKLTNVIQCSWWWVTCPLWAPIGILLGISILFIILALTFGRNFSKRYEGKFFKMNARFNRTN
jgi:hypothetical protein